MPNYASNKLTIRGDKNLINRIVGESFSFKNTIPPPEGIIEQSSSIHSGWFMSNWGVKWDTSDQLVSPLDGEKGVEINFSTPWNPPIKWLEKVIVIFPQLSFTLIYIDGDYPKCGKITGRNGIVQTKKEYAEGPKAIQFIQRNFT